MPPPDTAAPDRPTTEGEPSRSPRKPPGLLRNVFSNWTVFLFTAVANFFLSPFVVHSLGNEVYGTWALLVSLVGYLGFLDLGVRGAVTRYIARMHAIEDHEASTRYASAGLFVFSLTSVAALLGGVGISFLVGWAFQIPPELVDAARLAVILSSGTVATAFIGGVFGGIVTGLQRFDLNAAAEIGVETFRVTAIVAALSNGYGLVALAAIQLTTGVMRMGIAFVLSRRLYPEVRPALRGWSRSDMRDILGFSLTTTVLQGAGMIMTRVDAIVIGMFQPVALIAYFAIAGNLVDYAKATVSTISHTVVPRISALEGVGEVGRVKRLPLLSARLGALMLLPIVVTFMVRGDTFIGLWMGEEYAGPSGLVLLILSLPLWFQAGRSILTATLMGLNQHKRLVAPMVAEAVLNLGLSLYLVQDHAILGVAWGTAAPALLLNVVVLPVLYASVLEVPLRAMLDNLMLRPALAMLPFLAGTVAVQATLSPESLLLFFLQVAMVLPLGFLGAWYVGLDAEERTLFRKLLPEPLRFL